MGIFLKTYEYGTRVWPMGCACSAASSPWTYWSDPRAAVVIDEAGAVLSRCRYRACAPPATPGSTTSAGNRAILSTVDLVEALDEGSARVSPLVPCRAPTG
jgi:hypothetical protein